MLNTEYEISEPYERHADTVYRVCYLFMKKHTMDIEDAVQTTFLLLQKQKCFESIEHEKAWLIVTASNVCRNMLKTSWRRKVVLGDEALFPIHAHFTVDETLQSVLELPEKYKAAIYLFYYEGYSCADIARLLSKSESTIWGYLHKGRMLLKSILQEGEK